MSFLDDLTLGQKEQRGENVDRLAFQSHSGAKTSHLLERLNKFRSAIRVAGIVTNIGPKKYAGGTQHLGIGQCQTQENCIPGRNIGDGNLLFTIPCGSIGGDGNLIG